MTLLAWRRWRVIVGAVIAAIGLTAAGCTAAADEVIEDEDGVLVVASPDGDLRVDLWVDDDGVLHYRVYRGGDRSDEASAIRPSRLVVDFEEASFVDDLRLVPDAGEPARLRTFTRELPRGKQRSISVEGRERTVVVENRAGDRLAVDIVAFDDGIAHRFRTVAERSWTLVADRSSFAFADDGRMYVQAYDRSGLVTPASEALYSTGRAVDEVYPAFNGWSFPALFATGEHWTLVTETAVGRTDVGSRLLNDLGSAEHVLAPPPDRQVDGPVVSGSVLDGDAGGVTLPWKVIVTSTDLADVVASNLVEVLAEPTPADDWSWVRPGRVSWSWWSDSASPTRPEVLRRFIDHSADLGWEYSLIDANWNTMAAGTIADLVAYGIERDVGIFLWYNSGGPHNQVPEQPRDLMTDRETRRAEMARIRDLGVAGIKVDFFHSDKASMNALSLDILADAAEFELLVNFHGITSPKGWHATWPNLLTTEAVRGAEQYKFDARFPALAAGHHTVLAFTRNVVGPMDYTPVTLSDADFRRITTAAHELALGVVFESGLQHLADTPASYQSLGPDGLDYLRALPVVWDEVRLLAGQPGTHVVLARRHQDRWWIGGLNGTDEAMTVDLDVRQLDGVGPLLVATDGDRRDDVGFSTWSGGSLRVEMAPSGGFVAWPDLESAYPTPRPRSAPTSRSGPAPEPVPESALLDPRL
ncbi:MAG: glycoside hydrolase family 97 catalytic domain-containing protein [Actinomycetota bacterium]